MNRSRKKLVGIQLNIIKTMMNKRKIKMGLKKNIINSTITRKTNQSAHKNNKSSQSNSKIHLINLQTTTNRVFSNMKQDSNKTKLNNYRKMRMISSNR